MGEHAHISVELSHPPTPPSLDIRVNLACKNVLHYMDLFPQPPFLHSIDPLDCTILCSFVPDSTLVVKEDQVVDGFGIVQPTYTIICDDYVWESKEEPIMKDDSLPSVPHLLYPNIPYDSSTVDFPYKNSFLDVSTSDRS